MAKKPAKKPTKLKRKPKTIIPPIVEPTTEPEKTLTAQVIEKFQRVCELWADGKSMQFIAETLSLRNGASLRDVIKKDRALRTVLAEFTELRGHTMFEKALAWADEAASIGPLSPQGLKIGIDAYMKAAALMAPASYGDTKKTELRDPQGRLLGTETTTTLSPSEAYERLLKQA